MKRSFFHGGYILGSLILLCFAGIPIRAESPSQIKIDEEAIRNRMVRWSQELGVTCTECHNLKNFTDDSSKNFKISIEHAKIVSVLSKQGFDGVSGPQATCFMCHQGVLRPPKQAPEKRTSH